MVGLVCRGDRVFFGLRCRSESGFNIGIANFLFAFFLPIFGHLRVRGNGLELEVEGEPRNRYPDLTIINM